MSLSQQIDALLPLVSKPTRYLGNEFHVVRKTPRKGMVQWCLLLPEVYEIGMSHWGLKILYEILNRREDSLAERAYAPWLDMEARMRRQGVPLFSLESRRPLREFDLVGFSLQYELTYTNLLNCLDLAGIPLRSEDRRDGDPLIAAGGPCASNPEPLSDFIDFFLIGDGEEAVPALTAAYAGLRGRPRQEILRELARLPGIYVPAMYEAIYEAAGNEGASGDRRFIGTKPRHADVPTRVQRQFVSNLETAPWPALPLVPLQEIVQDRLTVEVLRGCTQGCRFCQAGYLYRPVRERSVETILEIADRGIRTSGWDEIGLVSLSTADYTQLEPLADVLNARFAADRVALSLPSLRADSFGVSVADRIRETRRTGFTFAPEAGSERLRLAMNKNISDDEFFRAAEIAYERGWRLIKMYFMVGLPTETREDIDGIVHFVDTVRRIGRKHGASCSVNASVGSFVPKSHTPLQWDAFEDVESLRDKIDFLRRTIHSRWSRLKWHHPEVSHLEATFSMGDRRLGRAIEYAFRHGARFDGWTEHFKYDLWLQAFSETGVDPAHHTRARGFDEALPWDHIDIGVLKKWLIRERQKTGADLADLRNSVVADCRHGDCTACGIPGLPKDTKLTPELHEGELAQLMARASSQSPGRDGGGRKGEPAPVPFPVRIGYEKKGPARFLSHLEMIASLQRAFRMARIPICYSQGHNPHPKFSFGPPLPVGIEGRSEAFDVDLRRPWSPEIKGQLNAVLPDGLVITDGHPLPVVSESRRPSLNAESRIGSYELDFSDLPEEIVMEVRKIAAGFPAREDCVVPRTFWTPAGSRSISDWESPSVEAEGEGSERRPSEDGPSDAEPTPAAVPLTITRPGRRPELAKPIREVDLKKAIIRMTAVGPDSMSSPLYRLELDLHLDHPSGHTANPKVILEQLFRLSPELQARVGLIRTAILDERGNRVL